VEKRTLKRVNIARCFTISQRGERYTEDNIKGLLNMRDFMDTLRPNGIDTGRPSALNLRDIQVFAN
jgi:uncharacterized protein YaiI (UPF0178 family)